MATLFELNSRRRREFFFGMDPMAIGLGPMVILRFWRVLWRSGPMVIPQANATLIGIIDFGISLGFLSI